MKVVLVTSIDYGGPIEQSLLLARGLVRRGASVLVTCANEGLAERFSVDGIRAEVAPLRHQADMVGAMHVWRLARGADVVHAHDRRAGLWVRIGPRPRARGLRVYTAHGIPEPYQPQPVGPVRPGLRATLLYRGLDAALCSRADAVVVPSRSVTRDLAVRLGYPYDKLVVIPNGIDLESPIPNGGDLIGTLSALEPVKGVDIFLRGAAQLARRYPDWEFGIFGSGSDASRLASLTHRLGIEDRVERPGFVPSRTALARMRVYVLSSYSENAPMALLEAMAAGVPVVATNVGGVPEIVDDRVAQLVPPGSPTAIASAVERLCVDETLRDQQVRAARRRVEERFAADDNARAMGELYEQLLAKAP